MIHLLRVHMIGQLFWMHLEVLQVVSNIYRALIVTEEVLMREAPCYTLLNALKSDFLRLHRVPN